MAVSLKTETQKAETPAEGRPCSLCGVKVIGTSLLLGAAQHTVILSSVMVTCLSFGEQHANC